MPSYGEKMKATQTKLKKAPAYRFAAALLMVVPYVLVYAGIQIVSSLGPEIMEQFKIGESGLSLLSSLGNLSKALISVVSGMLVTKIGGKKVVITGLSVMTLAGVFYYFFGTQNFALLCIIRVIHGCGTGIACACIVGQVAAWFPKKERGIAQGAFGGFFGISTSIVTAYTFACTSAGMHWANTISLMLMVGCPATILLLVLFYKDIRKVFGVSVIDEAIEGGTDIQVQHTDGGRKDISLPTGWKEALRFPGFWLTAVVMFFYGASNLGVGFVMPLFLRYSGFDTAEVATIMSLGTTSSIIFAILGGIISDKVFHSRRCEITMIGFAGSAAIYLTICILGSRLSVSMITVLYFIAFGVVNLASGPTCVLPVETVAPNFAAQNAGTFQMVSGMGGFLLTLLYGSLIQNINAFAGMLCFCAATFAVAIGGFFLKKMYNF